jgi:hypothetical protein
MTRKKRYGEEAEELFLFENKNYPWGGDDG